MSSTKEKLKSFGEKIGQKADEALEEIKDAFEDLSYTISGKHRPSSAGGTVDYSAKEHGYTSDALINTLINMDNSYRKENTGVDISIPELPETLGLESKEYVAKTDEEIVSEAETELLPGYEKKVDDATEKYESTMNKQEKLQKDAEFSEEEDLLALDSARKRTDKEFRNDMILQGLVNSTINSYGAEQIGKEYEHKVATVNAEYDLKYLSIKNAISEAQTTYENALKEYDLSYAADLSAKISKLKQDEEKRLEEINNYNLKIQEREMKYQEERNKLLTELQKQRQQALFDEIEAEREYERENGVTPEKQQEYDKRLSMAESFYGNFDKMTAMSMMAESRADLEKLMGELQFIKLLQWNVNR